MRGPLEAGGVWNSPCTSTRSAFGREPDTIEIGSNGGLWRESEAFLRAGHGTAWSLKTQQCEYAETSWPSGCEA